MTSSNSVENSQTTFDELREPIDSFLEQHERDHPPHHRETLYFADFVKELIYHFCQELRFRSTMSGRFGDCITRTRVG